MAKKRKRRPPKLYRGYLVTAPGGTIYAGELRHGKHYSDTSYIERTLKDCIRLDQLKVGSIITIQVVENSKDWLEQMREWEGW